MVIEGQTNTPINIPLESPFIWFQSLCFPGDCDLTLLRLLRISYGPVYYLWTVPFELILSVCRVVRKDTQTFIYLNKHLFFSHFSTPLGGRLYNTKMNHYRLNIESDSIINYTVIYTATTPAIDIFSLQTRRAFDRILNITTITTETDRADLRQGVMSGFFVSTPTLTGFKFFIHTSLLMDYTVDMIRTYGKILTATSWTQDHSMFLTQFLGKRLPPEIICMIQGFAQPLFEHYLYWIPLEPGHDWDEKPNMYINLDLVPTAFIQFENKAIRKVYVRTHNILMTAPGYVCLRCV